MFNRHDSHTRSTLRFRAINISEAEQFKVAEQYVSLEEILNARYRSTNKHLLYEPTSVSMNWHFVAVLCRTERTEQASCASHFSDHVLLLINKQLIGSTLAAKSAESVGDTATECEPKRRRMDEEAILQDFRANFFEITLPGYLHEASESSDSEAAAEHRASHEQVCLSELHCFVLLKGLVHRLDLVSIKANQSKETSAANERFRTLAIRNCVQMACGFEHIAMLDERGVLFTMGRASRGQLGLGDLEGREEPSSVHALDLVRFRRVVCGGWHTVALSKDGDAYAFGWNDAGQCAAACGASKCAACVRNGLSKHSAAQSSQVSQIVAIPAAIDIVDRDSQYSCFGLFPTIISQNFTS